MTDLHAADEEVARVVPIDADTILIRVHPEASRQGVYARESVLKARDGTPAHPTFQPVALRPWH